MSEENAGQEMTPQPGAGLTKTMGNALTKLKTPVFWFSIGFVAAMIVTRKKKAKVISV